MVWRIAMGISYHENRKVAVMRTSNNLLDMCGVCEYLENVLCWLPLFHSYGAASLRILMLPTGILQHSSSAIITSSKGHRSGFV